MSDLSRTREARRALKTFLKSRALTGEPARGPVISRRFSSRPGQGVVELTESDIRQLLRAEREARKVAGRVIHEKLHLQRKNTVYVQRLKDWDALAPVSGEFAKVCRERDVLRDDNLQKVKEVFKLREECARQQGALSNLRASRKEAPVTEQTWKALLAERDRLQAENALIPALQEELQALRAAPRRMSVPEFFAEIRNLLREEML